MSAHVHDEIHPPPRNFVTKYVFSTDHKIIAIQFLFSSLAWLFVGGLLALAVRYQLAFPWKSLPYVGERLFGSQGGTITPQFYNMLFTMHGTVMVFLVIIPMLLGAFANYLIPLQIGARDMAFPRLNMLAYWMMWPAYFCFALSFFVAGGAASSGWTSYPPLSFISSGHGQTLWLLGITFAGLSSMMGAINYMTTIVNLRAPGMSLFRMPLTIWALFITSFLQAFAVPPLTAAGVMLLSDRAFDTVFFAPAATGVGGDGGSPLVWQHLFWFYSHPAVYIMVLPAMGIVSEVLATFSRKPIFGYRPMVFSMIAIAALGFIVWGHHMFTSGMSPTAATGFQLATLFIALPSAIKVFNWLATLFGGRIQFTTPMLHAIAFVCVFILGGLSGIWMAVTPADIPIHDTYVVVAHFHFILAGSSLFGIFAGVTFWFPKMFGRMLNEPLGKLHFALSFLFLNGIFLTMHQAGFAGMVRRVPDPYFGGRLEQIQTLNQWMTYAAIGMGATQLLLVLNLFGSLLFGRRSEANPWKATTLEWSVSSPPPYYNYRTIPTVTCGPHEYSAPDRDDDFTPQAAPAPLSEATA